MNDIEIEGVGSIGKHTKARALLLKDTRVGNIEYPLRFSTKTDLNHAKKVIDIEGSYNNYISIPFISKGYGVSRSYDKTKLDVIANGKSKFDSELEEIIKDANRKSDALTMLLVNIDPKIPITDIYDDRFMMLQTPLDVMNIFDSRHIGTQELEQRIRRDLKLIDQLEKNKIKMVRITIRQSKIMLEKKLKLIFGMEELNGISIQYGNPDYTYEKLTLLRGYANSRKWIHMFGVPKWATDGKTSMVNVLAIFGVDSISLQPHGSFKPEYIINTKRMNWRLGGYLEFPNEHRQRYGEELDCRTDCPPDHGKKVSDVANNYGPENMMVETAVHGAYETQYAFWETRMAILQGKRDALFKLYKPKDFLRRYITRIEKIDFNFSPIA